MSTAASSSPTTHITTLGGGILRELVTGAARAAVEEEDDLDLSGILWLEHLNLVVGDQELAKAFYQEFLGFTRDSGSKSFHINLGQQQFHLAATGDPPQVVAGSIGLVVESLDAVRERIPSATAALAGTLFAVLEDLPDRLRIRGPWGNIFHLYGVDGDENNATTPPKTPHKMVNSHALGGCYGSHRMAVRGKPGIRFVEVACPPGGSEGLARFYREVLGCSVRGFGSDGDAVSRKGTIVDAGPGVHLVFCETPGAVDSYGAMKGVHLCVYVNGFRALYDRLSRSGLVWTNPRFTHLDTCDTWEEARASRTLRFKDLVDPHTNEPILELEHETRPLKHGQYLKTLD